MKPKLKIFKLIALFTLFSTFFSCQEDEISVENENQSFHLKTSRLSINQVINEITNKQIKQKLQITNLSSSHNNSLFRSNNSSDYFIKKEKDDELTTYILNLNSYSQLKPYFLKLIITKNKNETEKMGFLKYIPTNPVSSLDLTNFTGKIEILDTNFQINATSEYVNGIKQISNQSNGISNRMICTDELLITEVKCSHTGNHGVGETCNNGYINDAYYVVSIFTRCNGDRTTPSQIIEDTSNPTGGTSSFSNTAYLYSFVDNLSQEELLIYVTNPSIQNYLVQNLIIAPIPNCDPMLGGDCTHIIIKPEVEQFAKELIDFYNDENIIGEDDLKNKIRQAIANGITSTAEFTHKIFKKFSNLAEEYPSSITYINSVLETINDAASTVTNTNPQTCTFADLFNMWLFELGPNPININGSNTASTNQLKIQEGVNQARNIALSKIQNGDFSITNHSWTYGQGEFYDGMSNGNFVTAFLGSYSIKVTISSTPNGYQLNFQVSNTSSWDSATRFRIDNDGNGVHDGVFPNTYRNNNNDLSSGGNFTQNWNWSETH